MPIIEISSLPSSHDSEIKEILTTIVANASKASGIPIERIVVRWIPIPSHYLVMNGITQDQVCKNTHHPIVRISLVEGNSRETEQCLMVSVAKTLSSALDIQFENVAVILQRITSGDLFVSAKFK